MFIEQLAADVFDPIAKQALGGRIEQLNAPLGVDQDHGISRDFDNRSQAQFAGAQLRFGFGAAQ